MPRARLAAYSSLESIGGVPAENRVSLDPSVVATGNSLEMELSVGAPDTRKAPMLPLIIVLAIELYVVSTRAKYCRFHAHGELLCIYGTMRGDDLKGFQTGSCAIRKKGVEFKLRRTKTTGTDRKVQQLPVFISHECSFSRVPWQLEGTKLMEADSFNYVRDYYQPLPDPDDLDKCVPRPAEYEDVCAFSRAMMEDLRVLHFNEFTGQWEEADKMTA